MKNPGALPGFPLFSLLLQFYRMGHNYYASCGKVFSLLFFCWLRRFWRVEGLDMASLRGNSRKKSLVSEEWVAADETQVPKSEAPGAPIFSGCGHFFRHLD